MIAPVFKKLGVITEQYQKKENVDNNYFYSYQTTTKSSLNRLDFFILYNIIIMKHRYIVERPFGFQVIVHYNKKGNYHGIYPTLEEAIKVRDKIVLEKGLKPKEVNNYFDNKEAYKEMVISKATGRLSTKLLRMSMLVVKNVNRKFRYKNEDDRQDVIAYSYEVIIKNWYNFDEEKYDNVFSWITEVVKRAHAMQFKILQKTRINTISIDNFYEQGKDLNI